MKLVESRPPGEKEINQAIDDGVRLLKDIIEMAKLGPIPVALLYDLEECLINGVYYLKFQKDLYSKYNLTLEQKYFLTTYYIIINCASDNNTEHLNLLKIYVDQLVIKVKKSKILILENDFIMQLINQEN